MPEASSSVLAPSEYLEEVICAFFALNSFSFLSFLRKGWFLHVKRKH